MNKTLAIGITGSFCNHPQVLNILKRFHEEYQVIYVITNNVLNLDTRFGKSCDFIKQLEVLSGRSVVSSLVESEWLVSSKIVNQMLIMPCSATTYSKLAQGIYDNAVLVCAKGLLRNEFPLTLAIASNDGLGISGRNLMQLINTKNIYFVPFGQDDYATKPNSLVSDFELAFDSVAMASNKKQMQPLLLGARRT